MCQDGRPERGASSQNVTKRGGRPNRLRRPELDVVAALAAEGLSIRTIAQRLRVPRSTVARYLSRQMHNGSGKRQKMHTD